MTLPTNTYEAMFLLDSNQAAVQWDETVDSVHGILVRYGAEIIASRQWDERRLEYPIRIRNVTHRKGTYLLSYFRVESSALQEIDRDCKLNEVILRQLIIKVHPKLEENLINQAMSSNPSEDYDDRDDYRPRRRDRDRDRDRDDDRERGDRDRPRRQEARGDENRRGEAGTSHAATPAESVTTDTESTN